MRVRNEGVGRSGRRAARAVAAMAVLLAGGCGIFNRTVTETPAELATRTAAEERIRAEVAARIAAEPALNAARLRVAVAGTEVSLYGSVPGLGPLNCAITNAELVEGVTLVIDHTVLDPGPPEAPCLAPRVSPSAARISFVKT